MESKDTKDTKYANYVFTMNNYTEAGIEALKALKTRYIVFGKEVAESGTPHLQGFVIFASRKTFTAARKALPGCHIAIARDPPSAALYCKKGAQSHAEWEEDGADGANYGKDADVYEVGRAPVSKAQQGEDERERYKRARLAAEEGRFDDIDDDIYMRHYFVIKKIRAESQRVPESIDSLDFHWWYGDSGSGKSLTARRENPDHYLKHPNKWWDGYNGQQCVIIDEWQPSHSMLAHHLKEWCDHHAFCAEVKGGTMCIRPPKVIITSNYSLEECFPNQADLLPLKRRFTVKRFVGGPFAPQAPLAAHDENFKP